MHLPRARHEFLLRELHLRGSVRSAQAAATLGVAEVTIRRDIAALATKGLLARVHGGAIAVTAGRGPQVANTLVGIVVPSGATHFGPTVRGAESIAAARRVRLILGTTDYRLDIEQRQVQRLLSLGVEGLIIAPTTRERSEQAIADWVAQIPVPCVLLERRFGASAVQPFDYVRTDHAYGAGLAVEHLAERGHHGVATAIFDRTPTAATIRQGHQDAVARLGLMPAPDVSLPKPEEQPELLAATFATLLDQLAATDTSAVLVHTDDHANRLIETAMDRGMRVPQDLAVVAYDDEYAELGAVPISAVAPPRYDLGREALRMLLERLGDDQEGPTRPPRHLDLLPRLMVRASSGG